MNFVLLFLQNVDINQKLKDAPDSNYAIGVLIGTILPFLILVIIAFAIYRSRKKKIKND